MTIAEDEPAARPAAALSVRTAARAACRVFRRRRRPPIRLSIGEPQHATPELVRVGAGRASRRPVDLSDHGRPRRAARGDGRLVRPALRPAALDPATQVLPVNGTREALFAFAQAVVDTSQPVAARRLPEPVLPDLRRRGAARRRRAGVPQPDAGQRLRPRPRLADADAVGAHAADLRLLAGQSDRRVLDLDELARRSSSAPDRYGFVIASDECYSEIYSDEAAPPLGGLEAAHRARPRRLPEPGGVHQPVEALERAGPALGRRRRRRARC